MENNIQNILKVHHPRIDLPYISQSIELEWNEKFGRVIIANESLLPGQIVAIEEPFFISMDKRDTQQRCTFCMKLIATPIVCPNCRSLKFCSESCKKESWEYFHKFECDNFHIIDSGDNFLLMMNRMLFKSISMCGSLNNLKNFIDHIDESITIFSKNDKDNFQLACCYNLECGNINEDYLFIEYCVESPFLKPFYSTTEEEIMLKNIVLNILGILNRNSFTINFKSDSAGAIFPFGCLINHSCAPNIEKVYMGNKAIFICSRPIEKNEQLFMNYRRPFYYDSTEKRRRSLYRQFNFVCECEACLNDEFSKFSYEPNKSQAIDTVEEYKENWKFIEQNSKCYPSNDVIQAIHRNKTYLQALLNEY